MDNEFSLQGKVAVVTGGARGIGGEMLDALAAAGADVVAIDILDDLARETAAKVAQTRGVRGAGYRVDVTDPGERHMNVNVNGVFYCCKAAGRKMIERKRGSIITISSMSGLIVNRPQPQSAYNASKAAVIQMTRSLAAEWAPHKVRVNTIAPGYIRTWLTEKLFDTAPDLLEKWQHYTPMGRMGETKELRGPVVYLASEASSFMTGGTLVVDGGYSCW